MAIRKRVSLIGWALLLSAASAAQAQSNTFPPSGPVGIGTTNPQAGLDIEVSANPEAVGFKVNNTITTGSTTDYPQNEMQTLYSGTGSQDFLYGMTSEVTELSGSGPITNAYAGLFRVINNNASGSITNAYGVNVSQPYGNNPITNAYGLYIGWQKVTGVTSGYGVFQVGSGDINSFAGSVGIGTTTPAAASLLSVGASSQFQVGSTGAVTAPSVTASGTVTAAAFLGSGTGLTGIPYSAITGAPAAGVSSVFGRTGAVTAASSDYSVNQITGAAPLASPVFTGKVGIGLTNPFSTFHVNAIAGVPAASGNVNTGIVVSAGTGGPSLNLGNSSTNGAYYSWIQSAYVNNANVTEPLVLQQIGGNVGIGTTSPGAALEVNGNLKLTTGSGASITFQDGTTQSTAYTGVTCGGDYAESVDVAGDRTAYEPGDVLVIGAESTSDVVKSAEPYSTLVAGIYSTKPGLVGRRQTTNPKLSNTEIPMAMVGIVPTKVSAENGAIKRGDLLVTSGTLGYAMKGTDPSRLQGAVVGKALGALESGKGVIEVLVTLQ